MFSFPKSKHDGVTLSDPTEPEIDQTKFPTNCWSETPYVLCNVDVPSKAPFPRGTCFTMRAFVDSDHARDSVTLRSRTGFIVFLKIALIFFC